MMTLCTLHIYKNYGQKLEKEIENVCVNGIAYDTVSKNHQLRTGKNLLTYDRYEYGTKFHSSTEMTPDMGFAIYNIHKEEK